ncbi:uncharacterized protein LOC128556786 [Mercenaria mercenaria]|uniref:uncharacterized protein LOC128556786 n=1 Tax=Mercenaria mercenaria TaxID=6596 RepID=UPI00234EAE16|nr:uncharacterized protein LOC128556786 [Mercenaria mercenaria]
MEIQHVIPRKRLLQAKTLYNSIVQHKALFLQAVSQENGKKVHIKSTMTFRERVVNAVCKSRGPAVSTRALQRQMKGALSDSVKVELEELQRTGFGVLKKVRCSVLFFKLPGCLIDSEIGPHMSYLKIAGLDVEGYSALVKDMSRMNAELIQICRIYHPQSAMMEI